MKGKLALFAASLLFSTPSLASFTLSQSTTISSYNPESDFGKNGYLSIATDDICSNDYVLDGYGCVTGELLDYGYDLAKYTFNVFTNNQLLNLSDDIDTNSVYLYIYRTDISKIYDHVSLSQADSEDDDVFYDYKLKPISISEDGHFVKYKVDNINLKNQSKRRYLVRYLYILETHETLEDYFYVNGSSNGDSFNEFIINNDEIQKKGKDLLIVTDKVVFFDIVPEQTTGYLDNENAKQLSFVFFNTDRDEYFVNNGAKLIEARLNWKDLGSKGFLRAKDGYYLINGILPSEWIVPIDDPLKYNTLESYSDFVNYDTPAERWSTTSTYSQYLGPCPDSTELWDIHNEVIKGETIEIDNGSWGFSNSYIWDTLGEVKKLDTNKNISSDLLTNYKWYINYSINDIKINRLYVKDNYNDVSFDAMGISGLKWTKDLNIESLSFLLSDNSVKKFITVDTYTDSIGYKNILNKNNNNLDFLSWLIPILLAVVGIVLLCVFFPVLVPIIFKVVKCIFVVLFIICKLFVYFPYLILVLPLQAIHAKRSNTKLKVWNPFKL